MNNIVEVVVAVVAGIVLLLAVGMLLPISRKNECYCTNCRQKRKEPQSIEDVWWEAIR